jgi:dCTP deaminase
MTSPIPWKDNRWLPGVLNREQIIALVDAHIILEADISSLNWDASALDLHLSENGYEMVRGSIKPFNNMYGEILQDQYYTLAKTEETDGSFLLKKNSCYVFRVKERLNQSIKNAPLYGQATAKSTFGRVDVVVRLIVDGMKEYEKFNPSEVSSGEMFLEITPITFDVKIKKGMSISQLRFFYGKIEDSIIQDEGFINSILHIYDSPQNYGTLSVDIANVSIGTNQSAAAFCAKENITTPVELWKKEEKDKYAQQDFWEAVQSQENGDVRSITIKPNRFYILRSKERISLNEGVCIYCRAMDETLGEMRIHYAGFVHPCFGDKRKDGKIGTPLIFEVRGHNVKILLTHKEILARLYFYRMSKNVIPEGDEVSYSNQELNLSTLFQKNWN